MPNLEHYYRKKLNELKAEPVKIFGLVYPYVLIIGLIMGLVYVSNLSQVARAKVAASVPDTTVNADLKVVEPRTVPPVNIMAVGEPNAELIESGKNVYLTVCQSCHGSEGLGDGPGGAGLNPPPRNFSNPDGWKNGPKISQIYKTLEEGIPATAMIAYDYLLPVEKIGLAHYIRQTFIPNPPVDTQDELVLLDQTYQLSKGQEIPAQIPVAAAMEIVSKENAHEIQKIVNALSQISSEANEEGAKIFYRVTENKAKALTFLSRSTSWKGNSRQFINGIAGNLNQNGFNSNIYKLSESELNTLQSYMSKYF